jgi:hypothetical protein
MQEETDRVAAMSPEERRKHKQQQRKEAAKAKKREEEAAEREAAAAADSTAAKDKAGKKPAASKRSVRIRIHTVVLPSNTCSVPCAPRTACMIKDCGHLTDGCSDPEPAILTGFGIILQEGGPGSRRCTAGGRQRPAGRGYQAAGEAQAARRQPVRSQTCISLERHHSIAT